VIDATAVQSIALHGQPAAASSLNSFLSLSPSPLNYALHRKPLTPVSHLSGSKPHLSAVLGIFVVGGRPVVDLGTGQTLRRKNFMHMLIMMWA